MRKTEIDGTPERSGADTRALEPRPPSSELRDDPFLDAWGDRPRLPPGSDVLPPADDRPSTPRGRITGASSSPPITKSLLRLMVASPSVTRKPIFMMMAAGAASRGSRSSP